jgi:hypothetical protein
VFFGVTDAVHGHGVGVVFVTVGFVEFSHGATFLMRNIDEFYYAQYGFKTSKDLVFRKLA